MNATDKLILIALFISSLDNSDPIENLRRKKYQTKEHIFSRIDELVKNKLINDDKKTLTKSGRASLKVVFAGGVFDIIHPGHIHTLRSAKKLGDVLVVIIATKTTVQKMKKRTPLHSQNQRKNLVSSLSMVDICLSGDKGDIFKIVDKIRPQIIALGYDQIHQEEFIMKGCKKINLDVKIARLQSLTPEISSSTIEQEYKESIHGI